MPPIVVVEHGHVPPARERKGGQEVLEAVAVLRLLDPAHAPIIDPPRELASILWPAVVGDDDLEIVEVATQHAVQGPREPGWTVVRRQQHGDSGGVTPTPGERLCQRSCPLPITQ